MYEKLFTLRGYFSSINKGSQPLSVGGSLLPLSPPVVTHRWCSVLIEGVKLNLTRQHIKPTKCSKEISFEDVFELQLAIMKSSRKGTISNEVSNRCDQRFPPNTISQIIFKYCSILFQFFMHSGVFKLQTNLTRSLSAESFKS